MTIRTVAAACVLSAVTLAAQPQATAPQRDPSASIAKLPDWSGVWVIPFAAFAEEGMRERQPGSTTGPQLRPEAATTPAAAALRRPPGDVIAAPPSAVGCGTPIGMPNVMRCAFGLEFLFAQHDVERA